MDGPKRLAFTTLDPVTKNSESDSKVENTVRLEVDLLDSTDTAYSEISYTDLVKSTTGGDRTLSTNSEDPFHDDDDPDRLAAIAKHFEDKYNKQVDGKKKKKKRWREDYYMMELGDGYDENDTFIDNSEAYDEILPDNMTTKLGGFYINSGRLSLKELSDDSDEEFQREALKKTKKRRISSDDDSENEEKKKVVKKKKIKDSLSINGEVKKKKKKKIIPPGTPGSEKTFKKPKQIVDKEKKKEKKSSSVAALIKSTSPNLPGEGQENGVLSPTENGEPDDNQSIIEAIEAVVAAGRDAAGKDDSNSQDDEEPKKEIDPESIPKLPTNLPAGLEAKIEELKNKAKETRDGKCKFFTTDVNKILLEVEISSKQMTVGNRSTMFGHLAAYLPCSKDTLMKRAKGLRVKDLEDKIKEPMEKLKQAVNRLMPALQEKYNEECKKFAQEKQANEQKEQEKDDTNKEKEGNQTESDEEESKTNQSEGTKKRQTGPRKKFEWDNNTRMLLCDVVRVKMQTFHLSKARSETAEEFCKAFLDKDVRPLWPKGWMQKGVLFKESRPAHANWTNLQKPKKMMLANKMPGSASTAGASQKPSLTSQSAPSSVATSKLTANKTVTDGQKSTPTVGTKPPSSAQNTPVAAIKKITPTLLNYDTPNVGNSNIPTNNSSSQRPTPHLHSALISNMSPKKTVNEPKPSMNPAQSEQSWDHVVSDILRSSFTPTTKTSPPKSGMGQPGRAHISPSGGFSPSSSFMAQFEQFAKNASRVMDKDLSPNSLASAQMQLFQKQLQEKLNSERREEALKQLKMLEKQSKLLHQPNQDIALKQQQQKMGGSQQKIPSQSPMSMAMGRNPNAQKVTPKQLSNVFQKSPDSASSISESVIRQHLNDPLGNLVSPTSSLNRYGANQTNKTDHMYGQISVSDQLRKSSPQASPSAAFGSQAKPGQGHIKVTSMNQGPIIHNSSLRTATTNGKPTTSINQSLFNIPPPSGYNNTVPSPSSSPAQVITIRRPGTVSPASNNTSRPHTLPATSLPNFLASNVSKSQGYPAQNQTLPGNVSKSQGYPAQNQTLTGHPNIRLPTLTNQQIAMFKEVAKKQQQQQHHQQQQQNTNRPLTDTMK